jgi:hypothetical protein
MDPDNHEPHFPIFFIPGIEIGESTKAIDTTIGPKVQKDNLPTELADLEGFRIDPGLNPFYFGGTARPAPFPAEKIDEGGDGK